MKTFQVLATSLALLSVTPSFSQNTKESGVYPNDEIPFYYKDGVKYAEKSNTPLIFAGIKDPVSGNTPSEMAKQWIEQHKTDLGFVEESDLVVYSEKTSLAGSNVRLRQYYQGVPVYLSEIVVHISPRNEVTYVTNNYDPTVQTINTSPALNKPAAMDLAMKAIDAQGKVNYSSNDLYVYNRGEATQLIYKIVIEAEAPLGSWEVLLDANTGLVVRSADKACNHKDHYNAETLMVPPPATGTGNVFIPDPLSFALAAYGGQYVDGSDATNASLNAAMTNVNLLDINFTGSQYELIGPYAEIVDFESPFNGLFSQASPNFNFNRNDNAFEAVNCYYHLDNNLRYINETLGISCMPFQYSGGMRFDPSGLSGSDNSHYLGGSGNISFGEGGVDDAEDADVILHELGHGIHDWLTSGNLSQVNGLSEGSGDYWATSYSRSLGQWTSSDAAYNWMFSWDGHNPFWSGRVTNYSASYPGGLTGAIHTDGQIWVTSLMRIYDQIGRDKVDPAFLEGLAMTGSSTSQQDAAIAVRQAAIDMNYSCADIQVFTQEFTATGYVLPPIAAISGNENSTICTNESVTVNGTVYDFNNPSGTEVIANGSQNGCDSTVNVNLNFFPAINAATSLTDLTITATQGGATYQWVDCDNGNTPLAGATNQSYTATVNGNYAVEITVGGCTETSGCVAITKVGLGELSSNSVLVYPNPSEGLFQVEMKDNAAKLTIQITDAQGKIVRENKEVSGVFTVDLSREGKGIYFMHVSNDTDTGIVKLIVR